MNESTKAFTETTWRLEWLQQYDAGDATVPSDSQLAEANNVGANLLTVTGGEAPEHMGSTKSDHVWEMVLQSLHQGKMVSPTGTDTAALPAGKTLASAGIPAGLKFNGP